MNNPVTDALNAAQSPTNTTSLDLPPALASILSIGSPAPAMPGGRATGMASGMTGQATFAPSYEVGGMIGAGGMPEPTGAGGMPEPTGAGLAPQGQMSQGGMSPQMLEAQVNQTASQHPQQIAQIRAAIMEVMQTGQLTPQELNTVVQLATVAAQNPEMYPYIRKFAIQQGIATEQDLPQQYDQGLVFVILLAARAVQSDIGGQNMMQGGSPRMLGGEQENEDDDNEEEGRSGGMFPSMAKGGAVPQSRSSDGSVLINAHEGEYVIPANVVKMKGKEFFDNLVEKYKAV